MEKYFFVLGRYPQISVAEITSTFSKKNINFSLELAASEVAVFSLNDSDLSAVFNLLGGSIKYGKIAGEVLLDVDESDFEKYFSAKFLMQKILDNRVSSKVHFGISIYNGGGEEKICDSLNANLKYFNKTIKENLKSEGISSGFLRIKERTLSSVAVLKNELLSKGFELVLIAAPNKILIGKTSRVQDFTAFTKRDMLRPGKDKKSGILPVKLARMMLNCLGYQPEILLDPFCGSGTVLMEAALLGIKNLKAIDIEEKAVNDTKMNLEWLIRHFNLKKENYDIEVKIGDARSLDKIIAKSSVDAIVTEPFLGPPQIRQMDENYAKNTLSNLTPLYSQSLNSFNKILKKNGRIVMVLPFYKSRNGNIFMNKNIIINSGLKLLNSLIYESPGQFVGREIIILEKF